jgi:hypothetical protein
MMRTSPPEKCFNCSRDTWPGDVVRWLPGGIVICASCDVPQLDAMFRAVDADAERGS